MKIRFSKDEGTLRNVDDDAPGILGLNACGEEPVSWIISPTHEPTAGPGERRFHQVPGRPPAEFRRVPAEEAVYACATDEDVAHLWHILLLSTLEIVKVELAKASFTIPRELIDFQEATVIAVQSRGIG